MELPCALGFVPKGGNPDTPSMNCVRRYPASCDVCTAYDAAPAWPDPPGCSQRRRRAPCFGVRQNRSAQISAQSVQVRACAICVFPSAAARSGPSAAAAPVCPALRDEQMPAPCVRASSISRLQHLQELFFELKGQRTPLGITWNFRRTSFKSCTPDRRT